MGKVQVEAKEIVTYQALGEIWKFCLLLPWACPHPQEVHLRRQLRDGDGCNSTPVSEPRVTQNELSLERGKGLALTPVFLAHTVDPSASVPVLSGGLHEKEGAGKYVLSPRKMSCPYTG